MANKAHGKGVVVVGGQWGDEGKGRIIDILSENCDVVARFQGGNNAGHSLHFDNKSLVLHLIPCGIVRRGKIAVIGNGVVLDPAALFEEMASLKNEGFLVSPENLKISRYAHIILPFHKIIDVKREESILSHIGTTKRGIGPCYEDKAARFGLRAVDLLSAEPLKAKLDRLLENHCDFDAQRPKLFQKLISYGAELAPYLCDTGALLQKCLESGGQVLFEGAQGSLLDIDHGTYPFVTSSNCVASMAATGSGIGSSWLNEVLMVAKAYCTRVGEGPFFSEVHGALEDQFRQQGHEYGATTGRPRRCGWLDIPALKYAARINGATGLIMTKIDVLVGLGAFKVVSSYEDNSGANLSFSEAMEHCDQGLKVKVNYEEFKAVDQMPDRIHTRHDLPLSFQKLLSCVEEELQIPIKIISFGAKRGQEIHQ